MFDLWTNILFSAASAIAANTLLRSLFGATFPLFATYLFKGLGIQYASTLLGGIAALLVPIPIFFYVYGPKIRAKSAFAPTNMNSMIGPDSENDVSKESKDDVDYVAASNVPRRTRSNTENV